MKKQNLTEEIYRMRKLMNFDSKEFYENTTSLDRLVESKMVSKLLNEQDENADEVISSSVVEDCIPINHTGKFSAEKSDATKPFKDFITKMQTEINKNESLKKQIQEGGEVFITKLKIMGGASNYYNGKETAADLENDYTTPYAGSVEKDSGYEGNIGYAKSRAENLLSAMVSKLPEMSIKLKDGLLEDAKNNIVTKVINTGGKNDHKRPTETHKNPGQIVKIEMEICQQLEEGGTSSEIEDCIDELRVTIGYDGSKIENKKEQEHGCDFAVFDIQINGVDIRTINLNNAYYDTGTTEGIKNTNPNKEQITDFIGSIDSGGNKFLARDSDNKVWGKRMYTFIIYKGTPLWNEIMEAADNKLLISYQGKGNDWYKSKNIYAIGGNDPAMDYNNKPLKSHTSSVWMDINLIKSNESVETVKGWTKAKGRSDTQVVIADLKPCTRSSEIK